MRHVTWWKLLDLLLNSFKTLHWSQLWIYCRCDFWEKSALISMLIFFSLSKHSFEILIFIFFCFGLTLGVIWYCSLVCWNREYRLRLVVFLVKYNRMVISVLCILLYPWLTLRLSSATYYYLLLWILSRKLGAKVVTKPLGSG